MRNVLREEEHDSGTQGSSTNLAHYCVALAEMHHTFKDVVMNVLNEKVEFPKDAEVDNQFHDLLEAPLRKFVESSSAKSKCVVVVIDALDECQSNNDDWQGLLRTLAIWSKLPTVKMIVTSRNEMDIRDKLHDVSEHIVLETGEDTSEKTSLDIRLFFEMSFRNVKVSDTGTPWPGEYVLEELKKYAAGLLIWAKTVVTFVGFRASAARYRLEEIKNKMSSGEVAPNIDDLYGQVIYTSLSDGEREGRREVRREVRTGGHSNGKSSARLSGSCSFTSARGCRGQYAWAASGRQERVDE